MNQQGKLINGKVVGGIEWLKTIHPDGRESRGATWNPGKGCKHDCQWQMPDGKIAICYAKAVAEGVASAAYPEGFETYQWHPEILDEPLHVKEPMRIFLDSMADLMGHWVPDEHIQAVLAVCEKASWHTFLILTKNAPRLARFVFPSNVWVGTSAPPSFFMGKRLTHHQQVKMLIRQQEILRLVKEQTPTITTWMSIEPLSFNVRAEMDYRILDWVVIGAASNGRTIHYPDSRWFDGLVDDLVYTGVPVFYKGNLHGFPSAENPWREEYPKNKG